MFTIDPSEPNKGGFDRDDQSASSDTWDIMKNGLNDDLEQHHRSREEEKKMMWKRI